MDLQNDSNDLKNLVIPINKEKYGAAYFGVNKCDLDRSEPPGNSVSVLKSNK